jgi:hypothetical protein
MLDVALIAGTGLVTGLIGDTVKNAISNVGGSLLTSSLKRFSPAIATLTIGPRVQIPINHDLIRAVRKSWLQSLLKIVVSLNIDGIDDGGRLTSQIDVLVRRLGKELIQTENRKKAVTWAGLSASEVQFLYESAMREGSNLSVASSESLHFEPASLLALKELTDFLGVDHTSLVHARIRDAVRFGAHTSLGNLALTDLVTHFLLEELKRNAEAKTSFDLRIYSSILSELKTLGAEVSRLNERSVIDDSLTSSAAFQHLQDISSRIGSTKDDIAALAHFVADADEDRRGAEMQSRQLTANLLQKINDISGVLTKSFDLQEMNSDLARRSISSEPDQSVGRRLYLPGPDQHPMDSTDDRRLAAAADPNWRHVTSGLFMTREALLAEGCASFLDWYAGPTSLQLPVFWVEGRSGDGKSVFLLQLVQAILRTHPSIPFYLVASDSLPDWLSWAAQRASDEASPVAIVDDLPNFSDEIGFRRKLNSALGYASSAKVLTCSPIDSREIFSAGNGAGLAISVFSLPWPSLTDQTELSRWFGGDASKREFVREGARVVDLAFETAQGPMASFASRFWTRARARGLDKELAAILALNSVDLRATEEHVAGGATADVLRAWLQNEGFFSTPETSGYRLFHGRLAWELLANRGARGSLARHWAECIEPVVQFHAKTDNLLAIAHIMSALLRSPRLSETVRLREQEGTFAHVVESLLDRSNLVTASSLCIALAFDQFEAAQLGNMTLPVREYAQRVFDVRERFPQLAVWAASAKIVQGFRDTSFHSLIEKMELGTPANRADQHQSNFVRAVEVLEDEAVRPHQVSAFNTLSHQLRPLPQLIANLIRRQGHLVVEASNSAPFIAQLISQPASKEWALELAEAWLAHYARHPLAATLLQPYLARSLHRDTVFGYARDWLDANPEDARFVNILHALMGLARRATPGDKTAIHSEVKRRYVDWQRVHPGSAVGATLLSRLVKLMTRDPEIVDLCHLLLSEHAVEPGVASLIRTCHQLIPSQIVDEAAVVWLRANYLHNHCIQILACLLGQANIDPDGIPLKELMDNNGSKALRLVVNSLHERPKSRLAQRAAQCWVEANPGAPEASVLLLALAAIPSATAYCSSTLPIVFWRIADPIEKRRLMWGLLQNNRFVKGASVSLARVIAASFEQDDLSIFSMKFIEIAPPLSGGVSQLIISICERTSDHVDIPILLHEALVSQPDNVRLQAVAATWLSGATRQESAIVVRKLLTIAKAIALRIENSPEVNSERNCQQLFVCMDSIWDWCGRFGAHKGTPSIVEEIVASNELAIEWRTTKALEWVAQHGPVLGSASIVAALVEANIPELLNQNPDDADKRFEVILDAIESWFTTNPTHPGAGYVIRNLLKIRRRFNTGTSYIRNLRFPLSRKVGLVQGWLKAAPDPKFVVTTLLALLQTQGIRRHITDLTIDWIAETPAQLSLEGFSARVVDIILNPDDLARSLPQSDERSEFVDGLTRIAFACFKRDELDRALVARYVRRLLRFNKQSINLRCSKEWVDRELSRQIDEDVVFDVLSHVYSTSEISCEAGGKRHPGEMGQFERALGVHRPAFRNRPRRSSGNGLDDRQRIGAQGCRCLRPVAVARDCRAG